ncbi:MAG: hypothetical protein NTV01_00650 [Bacteroidia bacterium]|nr:hypothetical protein [Bacteroidia bacterium]
MVEIVKDIYFQNSREIAGKKGWNPLIKYNVFIRSQVPFMFGGKKFVQPVLDDFAESYEFFFDDGDMVPAGMATLLTYTGFYQSIGEIEGHIIGMISETTRAANEMIPLTKAAGDTPWLYFGARHRAPEVDIYWSYAALLAGAAGIASVPTAEKLGVKARGTMPHALCLVAGDTLKAAKGYGETFEDRQIMILPDTWGREIADSIEVLKYFGKRLIGVRLDTHGGRTCEGCHEFETVEEAIRSDNPLVKKIMEKFDAKNMTIGGIVITNSEFHEHVFGKGVTVESAFLLKEALMNNGGEHVQVVLTSGFNPRKIEIFKAFATPMDLLGIGVSVPLMATSDIVEKENEVGNLKRCCKVGRYENDFDEDDRFVPVK